MTSQALRPGKLPTSLLRQLLETGHPAPAELLLPPAVGEDACAIAIRGGALIAATDPITLTGRDIGAHAVVINANDVAVMGVRPRWFLAAVLLPLGTTPTEVDAIFKDMHIALGRLEVTLVGGHTEIRSIASSRVSVSTIKPGRSALVASHTPSGSLRTTTVIVRAPSFGAAGSATSEAMRLSRRCRISLP